jgi:AraC family transcriptional regulator, transcriptional activator of pobA
MGGSSGRVPVVGYPRTPGLPAVGAARFRGAAGPRGGVPGGAPHVHDFLVLTHVETGTGSLRLNGRDEPAAAGDLFVVGPGDEVAGGMADAAGWCVFFPPDVLAPPVAGGLVSWRAHPLLAPFTAGAVPPRRLHVPAVDRPTWSARFAALEAELAGRRDGHAEAAVALLTLLLVDVARLAADVPGDLRANGEPLLAAVFDVIEARFAEPISLRDVAAAVRLSPGHLTTAVGRRTGRTVQQWITERRMAEARRLLAGTDLPVEAVAARAGYRDTGWFIRQFRRDHGTTPAAWRRAGG